MRPMSKKQKKRKKKAEASQKKTRQENATDQQIVQLSDQQKAKIINAAKVLQPEEPNKKKRYSGAIYSRLGKFLRSIRWLLLILLFLFLIAGAGIAYIWFQYGQNLPNVSELKTRSFAETTTIYDREGNVLYKIFGEENRKYVPLSQINTKVIDATIAIEDKNFFNHFGFDPIAITRAQINNWQDEGTVQGASTITQQLAKNLYLTPERTIDRKIKELLLSLEIEWLFSKPEILEMYFNKIPYGSNAFGIEAAANTFFGKSSAELNLVESAILASLPKAPSKFSPYGSNVKDLMGYCKIEKCDSAYDTNYVWGRKDLVLKRMLEDGKINEEEFNQAWAESFNVKFRDLKHEIKSPHFVFYVRDYLEKTYGKELVESGGLEVVTSLDPQKQQLAEEVIKEFSGDHLKKFGANSSAMVSLDVKSGQVLAMVGSTDYWNNEIDGQVNIVTSLRQPGSSFKPLIYAAAVEHSGLGTGSYLGDYKTKFPGNYMPNNSDDAFKGRLTVRRALALSRNIPAIKAFYLIGGIDGSEEKLLQFLNSIGITSPDLFKQQYNSNPERKWDFVYGPAIAIGSAEVTLLELTGGYATLGNGGVFNPINPILEIRDREGNVVEKFENKGQQVMRPDTAYVVNSIISDVMARPAGSWRFNLTVPDKTVTAKTGTSNKKIGRVNYPNNLLTMGYSTTIATGVWVGHTKGDALKLNSWGEFSAAPIFRTFMTRALADTPNEPFPRPESVIVKGNEFFPANWNPKRNYDDMFKPLVLKDCTDDERKKDPTGCKSAEQQKAENEKKKAETKPLPPEKPIGPKVDKETTPSSQLKPLNN